MCSPTRPTSNTSYFEPGLPVKTFGQAMGAMSGKGGAGDTFEPGLPVIPWGHAIGAKVSG